MAQVDLPFVGGQLDTNDPEASATDVGVGTAAIFVFFVMIAIASYAFDRVKNVAGVDGETEIPGV